MPVGRATLFHMGAGGMGQLPLCSCEGSRWCWDKIIFSSFFPTYKQSYDHLWTR